MRVAQPNERKLSQRLLPDARKAGQHHVFFIDIIWRLLGVSAGRPASELNTRAQGCWSDLR